MDPSFTLFFLRLLSAAILLGFLVFVAWLIMRDMRATAAAVTNQDKHHGQLLVIANDTGRPVVGTVFPLRPVTSLGRASNNTIVLDDNYASGEHALITRRGELWWLEDLGSRNGMLLNDLPLRETAVVSAGDVITIGSTKLKFEF
jgi:hypothetical protein